MYILKRLASAFPERQTQIERTKSSLSLLLSEVGSIAFPPVATPLAKLVSEQI